MALQTEIQSEVVDLAEESFQAFSSDISTMFGISMECAQAEVVTENVSGIKKRFKRPVAVNGVKASGALEGTFYLVFDRDALFTLTGTIVMLPEDRILENRKQGDEQTAKEQADAVGETGNLLVGAWDRIFREGLEGHEHFLQSQSFIGNPWLKPQETIGLSKTDQVLLSVYDVTIEPYPPFKCGVIFPQNLFGAHGTPPDEPADQADNNAQEQSPAPDQQQEEPYRQQQPAEEAQPPADDTEEANEQTPNDQPQTTSQQDQQPPPPEPAPKTQHPPQPAADSDDDDQQDHPVSDTIEKMTESKTSDTATGQPDTDTSSVLAQLTAKDVMNSSFAWAGPDDTVEHVTAEMQKQNASYALIGAEGLPEGIISKSDIAGALSPYLRNLFSKWRRPLDDATLRIKAKWIMSRPVRTVTGDTSLLLVIQNMQHLSLRAMPVINQQGKAEGIVTFFDIFDAITQKSPGTHEQPPPLL